MTLLYRFPGKSNIQHVSVSGYLLYSYFYLHVQATSLVQRGCITQKKDGVPVAVISSMSFSATMKPRMSEFYLPSV